MFFRHGAADEVCLSQGVARELLENLHDLLLINDDAVGVFEDRFQKRSVIHNFFGMILIADISGNEIHGARTVQRNSRDEVFETIWLQLFHELFHAALFELEHRVRIPRRNQLICFGHVVADFVEIDIDS